MLERAMRKKNSAVAAATTRYNVLAQRYILITSIGYSTQCAHIHEAECSSLQTFYYDFHFRCTWRSEHTFDLYINAIVQNERKNKNDYYIVMMPMPKPNYQRCLTFAGLSLLRSVCRHRNLLASETPLIWEFTLNSSQFQVSLNARNRKQLCANAKISQ